MAGFRTALFSAFVLCLAAAAPTMAEPFEGAAPYKEHLEFLGYSVEESQDEMVARHNVNYNVIVKALRGGVLLTSFFTTTDLAKSDTPGFHKVINGLNAKAVSVRYYADADTDLAAEAWYPGRYDRERFGILINEFNSDLNKLPDLPPEEKRFLE